MTEKETATNEEAGEVTAKEKSSAPVKKEEAKAKGAKKGAAVEEIIAAVKKMNVLDLSDLVKALEDEFGVTAAAPMMAAAPAQAAAPVAEEEKTEFDVILKDFGANKINVIRAVRELTVLGLKESKDLVEAAPKAVKEGVSKDEAAAAKAKLEAAGATAEIK